jgi:hypothetical protein
MKMNGKRFWTVLTVAAALTLFSSFAFGQILDGSDYDETLTLNENELKLNWTATSAWMTSQVDLLALQADALAAQIQAEIELTSPCEDRLQLYNSALVSLAQAWVHIGNAYAAIVLFGETNDRFYSSLIVSELALATGSLCEAGVSYGTAQAYSCAAAVPVEYPTKRLHLSSE